MKTITPPEAAYVAGIFDGEGTIQVTRTRTSSNAEWRYTAQNSVTNTNEELLRYMKRKTGVGTIVPLGQRSARHKHRFLWYLRVDEVKALYPQMREYLVIKQQQADLMLEFLGTCIHGRGRGNPLTEQEIVLKAVIFDELAELNKRGA